jgi:hypothetical protein
MYHHIFEQYQTSLQGRYIHNGHILPLLPEHAVIAGWSVEDREIYTVKMGFGENRILIWSQMHGNESTTTKAIMDLIQFLQSDHELAKRINRACSLLIIPILNPDGALNYTRENADGVDLNRDFLQKSQPESNLLWQLFEDFEPHFCFNMHDQRTIYSVGNTGKPATVSFLAPAYNEPRDWNPTRTRAAELINIMNTVLQTYIPGQIGRYEDAYNANCAGDSFQEQGVPTLLFEAGHFQNDYEREVTRKYIFIALLTALNHTNSTYTTSTIDNYLNIPQNEAYFFDFLYKNVNINCENIKIITNFAAHYQEELRDNEVVFEAHVVAQHLGSHIKGHVEINADGVLFSSDFGCEPLIGAVANFKLGNLKFRNGQVVK